MRVTHRVASLLAAGMFGIAGTAQAQLVNYFTTGQFSGMACSSAVGTTAVCSAGGLALTYTNATGINIGPPSSANFGNFFLTGSANIPSVPVGQVYFTLFINQTTPTTGQTQTIGSITGSVMTSPGNSSTLVWAPALQNLFVAPIRYHLTFDDDGVGANIGYAIPVNQNRSINGSITNTATPEPGTTALFATGLAGLIPVVIRRRKKAK